MPGTASRHSNYERRIQFGNLPRLQTRKNRPTLTTTHNFELQGVIYLRPSLSSLDVRVNAYNLFCSALALISHNQHTIAFVGTPTAQLTQPALFRFLNSQAVASSPTHACAPHHPRMRLQLLLLALPQFAEERSSQGHRTLFDQEFLSMAAFSTAHTIFRPRFRGLPPHHHMY